MSGLMTTTNSSVSPSATFTQEALSSAQQRFDLVSSRLETASYENWPGRVQSFVETCVTEPPIIAVLASLERSGVDPVELIGTGEPLGALTRLPAAGLPKHATAWRLLDAIAERRVHYFDAMIAVAGADGDYSARLKRFYDALTAPLIAFVRDALAKLQPMKPAEPDTTFDRHTGFAPRPGWVPLDGRPFAWSTQGALWRVRAEQSADAAVYALKEMKYEKGRTKYERFEREIEVTTLLSKECDAIVPVVDSGFPKESDGWRPFYVMPLAETSLDDAKHLKGRVEPVLEIGIEVARALEAAHKANVIHRDVKPANVLLFGRELRPALADFGIAYLESEEERVTGTDAKTLGSRDYAAPELFGGGPVEDVDARADIYSLGKTLYAAVVGGRPFPREDHRTPRHDLGKRFSDARMEHLHGLLDRMVVHEPDGRFATMAECREQMQRALANVREGIPYSAGMYGGGDTPPERAARLTRQIETLNGLARADALMDATIDATAAAAAGARGTAAAHPARSAEDERSHAWREAAIVAADHFLAVGLPILQVDDAQGFQEWLAAATAPLRRKGAEFATGEREILRGAAVLAVYGAGAAAWSRRRFQRLADALSVFVAEPDDFIRVALAGGTGAFLTRWLMEALGKSAVIPRSVPRLVATLANDVNIVSGLAALLHLHQFGPSLQSRSDSATDRELPRYPALYGDGLSWVRDLSVICRERSDIEAALASAVFGLDGRALRVFCRKITPVLANRTEVYNSARDRIVDWHLDADGDRSWSRWCHTD
jgi:hypothetical protein